MKKIQIVRTKKGLPAIWEQGGGYTNTGEATIICNKNGEPKTPLYIATSGHLACAEHALLPLEINDVIISVSRHRDNYEILVTKVSSFDGDEAIVEEFYRDSGTMVKDELITINSPLPDKYSKAIWSGIYKSHDYHCREPYYIK